MLKTLLDYGADLELTSRLGHTALSSARLKGHQKIVQLLTEAGSSTDEGSIPEELVRSVQQRLRQLDYNPGPIDGQMDAETEGAIREFQKAMGLPVDGAISEPLIDALKTGAVILVLDRSGKERRRITCSKGESAFLGEVFVPCGATFIQDEGEIGGTIRH